jgi:hypothetical protein
MLNVQRCHGRPSPKIIPLTSEFPRVVFIEVAKELLDLIGFGKPTCNGCGRGPPNTVKFFSIARWRQMGYKV